MSTPISILGLSASDPVPGLYVQTSFAQGVSSGSGAARNIVLIGNKLSSGSATVDTVVYGPDTAVQLATESDAIGLFGAGSELHRMYIRAGGSNSVTPLYAIAVTESSGTKASRIVTVAGTATSSGVIRFWSGDEFVDTGFITNDGYAAISTAVASNINAQTSWAVTASAAASGDITVQAKQNGLRGNWLRCGFQVIPTTVGISVSSSAFAYLASGATADSNVAALATLATKHYYYQVSAAEDATQFGALSGQIATLAQPINGNRQRCFAGSVDTLSSAETVSIGVNNPRAEIVWLAQSDAAPCELAAQAASVYALEEASVVPRLNFNFYGQSAATAPQWKIKAPLSQVGPTRAQLQSALNNGLTPINVSANGSTSLERRITTYSLNGSNPDYRVRDAGKVTVIDFYADDLSAVVLSVMDGKNIGDDPVNNAPVPANVMTPRDLLALANKLTRDYAGNGLVDKVGLIIQNTVAVRETNPSNRLDIMIPLFASDIVNQIGLAIDQVG